MEIGKFVKSLLPSFGKDRVLEDIRLTRTDIKDHTKPAYDQAAVFFKTWKWKSDQMKDRQSSWSNLVKGSGNLIVQIEKGIPNILGNLDAIEELIQKSYNDEVAAQGFTYLKAQLLQFVETTSFVGKYMRKFLNYAYICETSMYEEDGTSIKDSLSPAEFEWIEANFIPFCTAFTIVTNPTSSMKQKLAEIPDVVVTESNLQTLPNSVGQTKIDPLQFGFIPVWLSPIYHVRMRIAEWQVRRWNEAKEELRLILLRKKNLEMLAEGKPNAKIQQEIQYLQTRVQDLTYEIQKLEKEDD